MNEAVKSMLARYSLTTLDERVYALKEIIQEIALLGLWRAKFFERAAFYGGSCLRILYGLRRFSEDLDFTLLDPDPEFDITSYENALLRELQAFGLDATLNRKPKDSPIETAFLKANTLVHLIKIASPLKTHPDQVLKVKLEVDKEPPSAFQVEAKQHFRPIPFSIKALTLPDLFAGKVHACLCRSARMNTKGRDWYDFLWYISRGTPLWLSHLHSRMVQTGHWSADKDLSLSNLQQQLSEKVQSLDLKRVKRDVRPLLENPTDLDAWSRELFLEGIRRLQGTA